MARSIQSYPSNRRAAVVLRRIAGGRPATGLGLQAALDAVKWMQPDEQNRVRSLLKER